MAEILRKIIDPVSPTALTAFINFNVDRMGMINTADILTELFGLKEEEVRDIYDGKLNVFSGEDGKLIISSVKRKEDLNKKVGVREENTKARLDGVTKLKKQGLSRVQIANIMGLCTETVRRYETMSMTDILEKRAGKPIAPKPSLNRNMWSDIITVEDSGKKITVYGFKNGSCTSAAKDLEWGWVSPNGDVFGGTTEYSSSEMLHDLISDVIVKHEDIHDEKSPSAFHTLESLGWIKFESGRICAEIDITDKDEKYTSVAPLITKNQQEYVYEYMLAQYMKHRTQPTLGFTPTKFPYTYMRVHDMDLVMFANKLTH